MRAGPLRYPVTLRDEPALLRTPRTFAESVLNGEVSEDLGPEIGNLLGFAKNFYLQYFAEEHGLEISRLDMAGQLRARRVERQLRGSSDESALLLVSHYITISTSLDETANKSDELEREEAYEEVLYAILELVGRIARWAPTKSLSKLANEAQLVHENLDGAVASLVPL
jgi:hypothetical protein